MTFPVLLTVRTCVVCAALFVVVGLPLAFWCSRSRSIFCRFVSFLTTLPLVFPPIAMGFLLLLLLGKNGWLGGPLYGAFGVRIAFSQTGVALAALIAGLPMVVRPVQAAMGSASVIRLEQAARTLGCGPVKTFLLVTVPQAAPSIASGLLLGVARASGEVGITMMLGGNISGRTNTLSLEVYNSVSRGEFDEAMRLCALLALFGLVVYFLLEKIKIREV